MILDGIGVGRLFAWGLRLFVPVLETLSAAVLVLVLVMSHPPPPVTTAVVTSSEYRPPLEITAQQSS